MATAFVFGAGASRHVGYPLASEMGKGLIEFMLRSQDTVIRASGESLIDLFGDSPNIEDLITDLQSRISFLKNSRVPTERFERSRLGRCLGWLGVALQPWFREIHTGPAPDYATFAEKILQPGDTIVTFNYDDSLERELRRTSKWDVSQGYGFQLSDAPHSSGMLVLKLHGSVNWLVSIFGGAMGGAFIVNPTSSLGNHPVIHREDLEFLGYEEFSGHIYEGGGSFPCLILPGRMKEFFYDTSLGHEYTGFWDHLWLQATEAMKRCDRIVLCGYSLLPVDQRACDLLLKRPRKEARVEIVSGSQSERIANDFRNAGFTDVEAFKSGYFDDWCRTNR